MRLGVLCSGGLGFNLLKHLKNSQDIVFVCTDSKSTDIIEFSKVSNIPLFIGNPRNGRIDHFTKGKDIDVLASINYLFIIEESLIRLPNKLAFNIHGSLLPKYRGRTPHVWSIINNETLTGITAHVIDEGCDTGDIILQKTIHISPDDTGATLLKKYEKAYIPIVEEVLAKIELGIIELTKQNEKLASYFGKRTPDDGLVDWNWQKERIRNWIRAQAYPYPGAFSFIEGKKIVIDEITFTNLGFSNDEPNGLIKSVNPILIKTPNGVIELVNVREGKDFIIMGKIAR